MTKNDFIFSDQRRHRRARHIAFWLVWCLAFNVLFHFGINVFRGWDFSLVNSDTYYVLGPTLFFIKTLIVNSLLAVIVPQILLTYTVMYWLLPNYFYKKRNPFIVALNSLIILIIFFFAATGFKYAAPLSYLIEGNANSEQANMSYKGLPQVVLMDQVSSLPIVLSIALLIKLVKRWWQKQKQAEQLAKENTKAELELLKAQVHPHFLFNTINNIYYFTLSNSAQAPIMIKKLSGLLNYIINECTGPLVPLEKEIKLLQDYMALEKIRYSDQMEMTVETTGNYENKMIAPLLMIPFVENSFKHGASKMITQPWVHLTIKIEKGRLNFIIKNSKPATNNAAPAKGNIGLKNVKKRLALLYPSNHELNIINEPGCYTVILDLQLYDLYENKAISNELNPQHNYALA